MDMPVPPIGPSAAPDVPQPSPYAQQIADAAKQLPVEDLTTLMHGISPEALEVMEKIPDLAMFANFIESGGNDKPDDQTDPNAPSGKPGVAVVIGVGKDPRADVGRAMAQHGVR